MSRPLQPSPYIAAQVAKQSFCTCGHLEASHVDGECKEPTSRCECKVFIGMCLTCRHQIAEHATGVCARILKRTGQPCGCLSHPVKEGS